MGWNVDLPPPEFYRPDDPNLDGLIREACDLKELAIDSETDGLIVWKCVPYFWSISWDGRRICMPATTLPLFKPAFDDPYKSWVFANAKFDAHMLANVGLEIKGKLVDTQVMHSLLYEEEDHDLKSMAEKVLGWKWTDFGATFGSMRKGICVCQHTKVSHTHKNASSQHCRHKGCSCTYFKQCGPLDLLMKAESQNLSMLVDYASNDAYGTWQVFKQLKKELEAANTWSLYDKTYPYIETLADLFFKIEVPFTKVLFNCERNGIKVDKNYLESIRPSIQKTLDDLEKEINQLAGYRLNPSSTPQLRKYFFEDLGLPITKRTKGGKSGIQMPSVDVGFLESAASDGVPMAKLLLEHRKVTKQMGTYVDGMLKHMDPKDRVHTRFNQDVARTGRLSSAGPNLQNISSGGKDEFKLRSAFIPEKGNDMIVADYSQLEMRLLACASMEPKIIEIFMSGKDIHTGNVEMVFGIPYKDVEEATKIDKAVKAGDAPESEMTDYVKKCLKLRKDIKVIGFGLNYGMKEKLLAKNMGCTEEEAYETRCRYLEAYPAVNQFYANSINDVKEMGAAFTILGRRRKLPDIQSANDPDRWRAERQASNLPIQGSAADIAKMAMILIYEDKLDLKYECLMLLQVHDELVFECPKEATKEVMPIIKEWMEHPLPSDLVVPLDVEIGAGSSWHAAK